MKKLITLIALVAVSFTAFSQSQYPNYYNNTGYAGGGPGSTGASINYGYGYLPLGAVGKDTLSLVTNATFTVLKMPVSAAYITLLSDTTGDTAAYSNLPAKARIWYKKNPFSLTKEGDAIKLIFIGNTTRFSTIQLPWNFAGVAGDTIHVAKSVTGTQHGSQCDCQYDFYGNHWLCKPYTTW